MDLYIVFAVNMRVWRERQGLTQEKLSELSDLDVSYISKIENGHKVPTLESVERICRGLEIKPSDILREWRTEVSQYRELKDRINNR